MNSRNTGSKRLYVQLFCKSAINVTFSDDFDLLYWLSDFSYSIVFLLDCSMWNTLDCEVNFELRLSLVRHGSHRTGSTLMRIFALNFSGILQNNFQVVDLVIRKLSDTESLRFWYYHSFNIVGRHRVVKDNGVGSSFPDF